MSFRLLEAGELTYADRLLTKLQGIEPQHEGVGRMRKFIDQQLTSEETTEIMDKQPLKMNFSEGDSILEFQTLTETRILMMTDDSFEVLKVDRWDNEIVERTSCIGREKEGARALVNDALSNVDIVELLIARLNDEDSDVRWLAAGALGKIGAPAVEPLNARLNDEKSYVRGLAARVLGYIRDPRAIEPLIARLNDESSDVRGLAAEALGKIGDPRAVEPLIARLNDEDSDVRGCTVAALVKIGAPALPYLRKALSEGHGAAAQLEELIRRISGQ